MYEDGRGRVERGRRDREMIFEELTKLTLKVKPLLLCIRLLAAARKEAEFPSLQPKEKNFRRKSLPKLSAQFTSARLFRRCIYIAHLLIADARRSK